MAITYVNAGTRISSAGATSATPALPASRVSGNLLIAVCGTKNNAEHTTATAEWNKIDQRNSGTGWTLSLFWKIVDGTDSAPAITWAGSVANFAIIFQYTGGAPSNPIGAFLANNGTTSPHTNAGLVATRDGSQIVYLGGAAANTAYGTATGWTENNDAGSNTGATRHLAGRRNTTLNTGQSSGSISLTGAASAWVLYQVELLEPLSFDLSGSSTDAGDLSAGTIERQVPSFDLSGSSTDAGDLSSGSIEREVPVFNLSGSSTDAGDLSSGTLNYTDPSWELSGSSTDAGDISSGMIEREVPVFDLSGSSTDAGDISTGTIEREVPVFDLSGSSTDAGDLSAGTIEREVPVFDLSGSSTDAGDISAGTIEREAPVFELLGSSLDTGDSSTGSIEFILNSFNLSGSSTDTGDLSSGTIERQLPVYELSGSSTDAGDLSLGTIERQVPSFDLSGSSTDAGDLSAGSVNYADPIWELSGSSLDFGDSSSGTINRTVPVYELAGSSMDSGDLSTGRIFLGEIEKINRKFFSPLVLTKSISTALQTQIKISAPMENKVSLKSPVVFIEQKTVDFTTSIKLIPPKK